MVGFEVLPRRWVLERTFGWLGRHRHLRTGYEADPFVSEALVYVAMIHLMLRRIGRGHGVLSRLLDYSPLGPPSSHQWVLRPAVPPTGAQPLGG